MKFRVKFLLFILFSTFQSSLVFAGICNEMLTIGNQYFCERYQTDGHCYSNATALFKAFRKKIPEFDEAKAKILIIYHENYPKKGTRIYGAEARKNASQRLTGKWKYHVVLEYDKLIYDLDFKNTFTPTERSDYFHQMFLDADKAIRVAVFNPKSAFLKRFRFYRDEFFALNSRSLSLDEFVK